MQRPIYLDYASTTPVDPRVAARMAECLTQEGIFGNPASPHFYGMAAKDAIDTARQQVATFIGATNAEIIFTSGATESNNIAIKGAAYFHETKGNHIITVKTEHKSVLEPCYVLAEQGFDVDYLPVEKNGLIDFDLLANKIRPDTILVSIMHVNNELGVIQDIQKIGTLLQEKNILFHVDAAQSAGKLPIDVNTMHIDLLSLSAHKMYGPKGVGALYVRRFPKVRLQALLQGGGHEQGLRPGTLATHQIVGMGAACDLAMHEMSQEYERIRALRDTLWNELKLLPNIHLNTDFSHSAVHFFNISFENIDSELLLSLLPNLTLATGAACSSLQHTPSHVLKAIHLSKALADGTIRITLGRFTTRDEILQSATLLKGAIARIMAS